MSPISLVSFISLATVTLSAALRPMGGLDRRTPAPLPFPISTPNFIGTIDGHDYNLTGSINEVHAQLQYLYPDIDLNATNEDGTSEVSPRENMQKTDPACRNRDDWWKAFENWVAEGEKVLTQTGGKVQVNGHTCNRLYCHNDKDSAGAGTHRWGSEIMICNDNKYPVIHSLPDLATYATDIRNKCKYTASNGLSYVQGQLFDRDYFNVVVRGLPQC